MSSLETAEKVVLPFDRCHNSVNAQYSEIEAAIVRELLQNSLDAGATEIEFRFRSHGYTCEDNGCGMTAAEFRQFFLHLGGTKKHKGSIGGFGAAKELLLYAWEHWKCEAKDRDFNGSFLNDPTSTARDTPRKGFLIEADNTWGRKILSGQDMHDYVRQIVGKSAPPKRQVKVVLKQQSYDQDWYCDTYQPQWGRPLKGKRAIHLRNGDLYKISKDQYYRDGYPMESYGRLYVRLRGLYTCEQHVGGDFVWYFDIKGESSKALVESRDNLRAEVQEEINRVINKMREAEIKEEKRPPVHVRVYGGSDGELNALGRWGGREGFRVDGMDTDARSTSDMIWHRKCAIGWGKQRPQILHQGKLRPKYARLLNAWATMLDEITAAIGYDQPVPGLYFGTDVNAFCQSTREGYVVCARVGELEGTSNHVLLELAVHEIAHYTQNGHYQAYESERMNIMRMLGDRALDIIARVSKVR